MPGLTISSRNIDGGRNCQRKQALSALRVRPVEREGETVNVASSAIASADGVPVSVV
jgi:hypothetical protein